jgi:RNA polymerase sigma-70 factor (ECF subfamily)
MQHDDPDFEAIRLIQQQNEQGLVDLMSRHREQLFRFIYRFVHNEADAAELTEQTFLRVYQKANSFKPKAKVSTWMFHIAGNICRDFLRKQKKYLGNQPLEKEAFSSQTPKADLQTHESLAAIENAIADLPQRLKVPFIFCVLEEHSWNDCAEALHTSPKAVETRIYRARKILQESLQSLR